MSLQTAEKAYGQLKDRFGKAKKLEYAVDVLSK